MDTTPTGPTPTPPESFVVTPNPAGAEVAPDIVARYARMRPDQRTAIANEFRRYLFLAGDTGAEHMVSPVLKPSPDEPSVPVMDSAQDVAFLHTYLQHHHPRDFDAAMQHPVTIDAMSNAGAAPIDEAAAAGSEDVPAAIPDLPKLPDKPLP